MVGKYGRERASFRAWRCSAAEIRRGNPPPTAGTKTGLEFEGPQGKRINQQKLHLNLGDPITYLRCYNPAGVDSLHRLSDRSVGSGVITKLGQHHRSRLLRNGHPPLYMRTKAMDLGKRGVTYKWRCIHVEPARSPMFDVMRESEGISGSTPMECSGSSTPRRPEGRRILEVSGRTKKKKRKTVIITTEENVIRQAPGRKDPLDRVIPT